MVRQTSHYLKDRKAYFLKHTLLWLLSVVVVFTAGLLIMGGKESYFTVMSGVLVIPVALNLSRFIGYGQFKDGKKEWAEVLDKLNETAAVFHSAILPGTRTTLYFEHIIVTADKLYFLTYQEKMLKASQLELDRKLMAKGLEREQIVFKWVKDEEDFKAVIQELQNRETGSIEKLKEHEQIINDLLM